MLVEKSSCSSDAYVATDNSEFLDGVHLLIKISANFASKMDVPSGGLGPNALIVSV